MGKLQLLEKVLEDLDVEIEASAFSVLDRLRTLLLDYNQHTNLTAIRDPEDVEVKLFADSLALLPLLNAELLREGRQSMRLIDIGTGAGFPGLPIAITCPHIEVTLLDATRKKVAFIHEVIDQLRLPNAIAVHGRSEDFAHLSDHRERYDVATARAVASLPALIELSLPFIRTGGVAFFPKGRTTGKEIGNSKRSLRLMHGELFERWNPPTSALPNTTILCVRKFAPTPAKYPRSAGIPAKTPL